MNRRTAAVSVLALATGLLTTGATGAVPATAAPAPSGSTPSSPSSSARDAAIARASALVAAHRPEVAGSQDDDYRARDVVLDQDGVEHVRFDRTYRGLPVLGGDFVVHLARDGQLRGVSRTLQAPLALSTKAGLSARQAQQKAEARFSGTVTRVGTPALAVYARTSRPVLAYTVVVTGTQGQTPSEMHYVLDATTGAQLDAYDGVKTASGSGSGYYDGTVALETTPITGGYSLKDPTRGNQYTTTMSNRTNGSGTLYTDADNVWGNGLLSNSQTVAVDAQYGTAETWDYYKNVHNRTGIADNGAGSYNRVHYGRSYNNAFWSDSCFCMTYGDGDGTTYTPFDSLDVAGHEMSHGVTSRTANLTYSGESGGLNEATSDIFGTMVEFYANNPKDTPDYLIGERIRKDGRPLRWMDQPSKDGSSADYWYSGVGSLNVHYSSGVANHFFYLLAVGSGQSAYGNSSTYNGSTVVGIGNDAARRIWYRALTVYMTSSTTYHGARTATLSAAADLYGSGSAEYDAVAAAWAAVNVT